MKTNRQLLSILVASILSFSAITANAQAEYPEQLNSPGHVSAAKSANTQPHETAEPAQNQKGNVSEPSGADEFYDPSNPKHPDAANNVSAPLSNGVKEDQHRLKSDADEFYDPSNPQHPDAAK